MRPAVQRLVSQVVCLRVGPLATISGERYLLGLRLSHRPTLHMCMHDSCISGMLTSSAQHRRE